jgi:tetratricopeptide (TPR) repeat protein
MQKQNEKQGVDKEPDFGEKINEFIQKNRKPIFFTAVALLIILIAIITTLSLMDVFRNKAIAAVEELNDRYEAILPSINEDYFSEDVNSLLDELTAFAKSHSGYSGGRAWLIIGGIHAAKNEWADAETAYASAAKKAGRIYIAPLAWFNAAAAAEEQGKTAEAIEYYSSSLTTQADFSSAPRAQFSVGRLHETLNEDEKAIEAYRAVISGWPYDQVWTNLARSRIIALETKTAGE